MKRLTQHYDITQATLLERVLLEEQRRAISEMTGPEIDVYHDSVTA